MDESLDSNDEDADTILDFYKVNSNENLAPPKGDEDENLGFHNADKNIDF